MAYEKFYFSNGTSISSIDELRKILNDIDLKNFEFHVNNNKNDFANWVENSLLNKELAQNLRKTTDYYATIKILDEYLENEVNKKNKKNNDVSLFKNEFSDQFFLAENTGKKDFFMDDNKFSSVQEKNNQNTSNMIIDKINSFEESKKDQSKNYEDEIKKLMSETKKNYEKISENNLKNSKVENNFEININSINNNLDEADKNFNKNESISSEMKNISYIRNFKSDLTKLKNNRFNELKALLLGTAFGLLIGMIIMYVLIFNGVF